MDSGVEEAQRRLDAQDLFDAAAGLGRVVGVSNLQQTECFYEVVNDGFSSSRNALYVNWTNVVDEPSFDFAGEFLKVPLTRKFVAEATIGGGPWDVLRPGTGHGRAVKRLEMTYSGSLRITSLRFFLNRKLQYECVFEDKG
jgi:hypothetical protein